MRSSSEEQSDLPLMKKSPRPSRWQKEDNGESESRSWRMICLVLFVSNCLTLIVGFYLYHQLAPAAYQTNVDEDPWFGTIPHKDVVWEQDDRFIETNPKVFYNQTDGDDYSIWSEIYPSGWVALTSRPGKELSGGALLSEWGSEDEEWEDGTQAWATTLMHQLHCLGTMKSTFGLLQDGEKLDHERMGHIPHCIEYFRQSFMCQADLTLEPPMDVHKWPQGTSGWGNTHYCRDWDAVLEALKDRSILREGGRWVRLRPQH